MAEWPITARNPIETIHAAGSDDNISLTFVNADQAEVYGVEIEWLKGLGFLSEYVGGWVDSFFFSGNATLSESEIEIDTSVLSLTNDKRPLSGHSDAVLNFQLGFDSPDGMHSASLVYNVFAERVFFGGRNGAEDTYEQPFQSVDLVYSFYPRENLTLKLAMKNLLDDEQEFEQSGVTVLEQTVGQSFSMDFSWKL
jgi:outer membrane receptor protein involved in Fe transport